MRAVAGQSASAVSAGAVSGTLRPRSVEGFAIGVGWLAVLAGRWWTWWLQTAARLAGDPAAFVNHR